MLSIVFLIVEHNEFTFARKTLEFLVLGKYCYECALQEKNLVRHAPCMI